MSVENVRKFYETVARNEALKQKFVELSQKYQGQQMDEAEAMLLLEQEVLPIARQMGYSFSIDDLKAYSEEKKQAGVNRVLSDSELEAISGAGINGTSNCFVIGAPDELPGYCSVVGTT